MNRNEEDVALLKPPIGLIPKWLWEQQRIEDIDSAILRYRDALIEVPEEWYAEREALLHSHRVSARSQKPGLREIEVTITAEFSESGASNHSVVMSKDNRITDTLLALQMVQESLEQQLKQLPLIRRDLNHKDLRAFISTLTIGEMASLS